MPSIAHRCRATLPSLSVRAAGIALACLATVPAAHAQKTEAEDNRQARIEFTSCAEPVYPPADAQAGHEGKVTLGFLIDKDGGVKDSKVTASSGFMRLDQAAQTALMKCTFRPALENGKPVRKWAHVQYVWKLR
jgi:TonB family protein